MVRHSAGLLLWRRRGGTLEVFLVHPGGPFWRRKDAGAWSIPKGEYSPQEEALAAAKRETAEETGFVIEGPYTELTPRRQPSGKIVHAFAVQADVDAGAIRSNTFAMEWPPRSGHRVDVPEVDQAAWFSLGEAREKVHRGQIGFLDDLEHLVRRASAADGANEGDGPSPAEGRQPGS